MITACSQESYAQARSDLSEHRVYVQSASILASVTRHRSCCIPCIGRVGDGDLLETRSCRRGRITPASCIQSVLHATAAIVHTESFFMWSSTVSYELVILRCLQAGCFQARTRNQMSILQQRISTSLYLFTSHALSDALQPAQCNPQQLRVRINTYGHLPQGHTV